MWSTVTTNQATACDSGGADAGPSVAGDSSSVSKVPRYAPPARAPVGQTERASESQSTQGYIHPYSPVPFNVWNNAQWHIFPPEGDLVQAPNIDVPLPTCGSGGHEPYIQHSEYNPQWGIRPTLPHVRDVLDRRHDSLLYDSVAGPGYLSYRHRQAPPLPPWVAWNYLLIPDESHTGLAGRADPYCGTDTSVPGRHGPLLPAITDCFDTGLKHRVEHTSRDKGKGKATQSDVGPAVNYSLSCDSSDVLHRPKFDFDFNLTSRFGHNGESAATTRALAECSTPCPAVENSVVGPGSESNPWRPSPVPTAAINVTPATGPYPDRVWRGEEHRYIYPVERSRFDTLLLPPGPPSFYDNDRVIHEANVAVATHGGSTDAPVESSRSEVRDGLQNAGIPESCAENVDDVPESWPDTTYQYPGTTLPAYPGSTRETSTSGVYQGDSHPPGTPGASNVDSFGFRRLYGY